MSSRLYCCWNLPVENLHSVVKARIHTYDSDGNDAQIIVETTPGRVLLHEIVPRNPKIPFELVNRLWTKKEISQVIDEVYRHCGQKETVIFADQLMQLGFNQACKAGISFGKDDMVVPVKKEALVNQTREQVQEFENFLKVQHHLYGNHRNHQSRRFL